MQSLQHAGRALRVPTHSTTPAQLQVPCRHCAAAARLDRRRLAAPLRAASDPEVLVSTQQQKSPVLVPRDPSLFEALSFNGPAPELINGRLAMIGLLAVARGEATTGATALQQAAAAPVWVWLLLVVWVYASMVPILKGARHEAFGPFSPRAEYANGRAAMLGFGILLALEYKAGVPFF